MASIELGRERRKEGGVGGDALRKRRGGETSRGRKWIKGGRRER